MSKNSDVSVSERLHQALKSCHVFAGLDERVLAMLASMCGPENHKKGSVLFREGDPADGMRIVMSGLVRVSMSQEDGEERTLRYLSAGDVVGEIALIDGLDRTATIVAEDVTECLFLPRAPFLRLLEANTVLNTHLLYLLAERLRYSIEEVGGMSFLTVRERLCRKLYDLSFDHGTIVDGAVQFDRKFSQAAFAKMIGASREATNRQLLALSRDGLLSLDAGKITIHELEKLLQS